MNFPSSKKLETVVNLQFVFVASTRHLYQSSLTTPQKYKTILIDLLNTQWHSALRVLTSALYICAVKSACQCCLERPYAKCATIYLEQRFPKFSIWKVENSNSSIHLDINHSKRVETVPHFISWKKKKWKKPMKNKTQLLLLGKFEYTGGPIFKVVLEC